MRALKSRGVKNFVFVAPERHDARRNSKSDYRGRFIRQLRVRHIQKRPQSAGHRRSHHRRQGRPSALQKAMDEARIIGESQNFTRELVNEPSNNMTPTILADHAKKMCQEVGLKCEVYGADKIKELKMGAFWGVAQGSDEPPALIVMRYEPAGRRKSQCLGLVGKGITFDTGGISIKPADGMEKMKYDMAGGATMIGAMRASRCSSRR